MIDKDVEVKLVCPPFPGLFPITDTLHLLQRDLRLEDSLVVGLCTMPSVGSDAELQVLTWNSYSVKGLRSCTLIRPPLSCTPYLSSCQAPRDKVTHTHCVKKTCDAGNNHKAVILPRIHYAPGAGCMVQDVLWVQWSSTVTQRMWSYSQTLPV